MFHGCTSLISCACVVCLFIVNGLYSIAIGGRYKYAGDVSPYKILLPLFVALGKDHHVAKIRSRCLT